MSKLHKYNSLITEGFYLMQSMNNKEACELWRRAIELLPELPIAYVWLSENETYYGQGPLVGLKIAQEGLKFNPKNAYLNLVAAMAFEYIEPEYWEFEEYINYLKTVLKAQPKWPWPRLLLAFALKQQGKFSKAKEEIYRAKNKIKPFICHDPLEEYQEYTFTGRTNYEIGDILDMYLKEINERN
jgi:tetratricopeptide (TPR) repeat protein